MPPPPADPAPLAVPVGDHAPSIPTASPTCAACEEPFVGPYCYACGESQPTDASERIGPVLVEAFQEVTSADGKLWRSLGALFVPGRLTEAYFSGRRGVYVRPRPPLPDPQRRPVLPPRVSEPKPSGG